MLQLTVSFFYDNAAPAYRYLYILSTHIWAALMFYPIGIVLSIFLVGCIYYMMFKLASDIYKLVKLLSYYLEDVLSILSVISTLWGYSCQPLIYIYRLVREYILLYSFYLLVFYVKRVEFYVLCFFAVTIYY